MLAKLTLLFLYIPRKQSIPHHNNLYSQSNIGGPECLYLLGYVLLIKLEVVLSLIIMAITESEVGYLRDNVLIYYVQDEVALDQHEILNEEEGAYFEEWV